MHSPNAPHLLNMQLSIPEPCHEDWAEMTPTDKGRHCASCVKTVVDFTKMSDAQVLAHLKQASGNTCGRVRNDQIERPLVEPIIGGIPRWISVGLASIAAVLGSTAAFGQQLEIQGEISAIRFDTSIVQEPVDTVEIPEVMLLGRVAHYTEPKVDENVPVVQNVETISLPMAVVKAYKVDPMKVDQTSQGLILGQLLLQKSVF